MKPLSLLVGVLLLGPVLASVACSGGSGSSVGSGSVSTTEDSYCSAKDQRAQRCAGDSGVTITSDRAGCGKEYRCQVALLANPDAYFTCRTKPECTGAGGDACAAQSTGGVSRPEADTCAKKYASCKSAGGKSFDDDTCPALSAIRSDVVARLMPCFDKACNEIDDCLEATVNAVSPDCN